MRRFSSIVISLVTASSAIAFDSYAESLVANGNLKKAQQNFQKAIELAKLNQDPNQKRIEENLKKLQQIMDKTP